MDSATTWAISCGLLFIAVSALYFRRQRTPPLPPGPKKLPLIGNLLIMPSHSEWETYSKWSKECNSDIIHLSAAGNSIIILGSVEAAEDLLDKRSAIYSDRPRFTMLNELVGGDFMFGERIHSRLFHQEFRPTAVPRFHPQELKEAHNLIRRILETPDEFAQHCRHIITAIIINVTYGLDVAQSNDPYLDAAHTAIRALSEAGVPGRYLVDIIPPLKYVPDWFPGAGFKRKATEWNNLVKNLLDLPFADAKTAVNQGTARPSFILEHLRALQVEGTEADPAEENDIKQVAGTIAIAGTDTLSTTLVVFFRAMLENPDVQKQAQKEIDSVVSSGHLPDFADEKSLPYVTAVVKETMRWWPVTPIGVPHSVGVEDRYRSYRIPAGSVVIANLWAMLQDESVYPDPQLFRPERFLVDGQLNPAVRSPDTAFGFGRRICPGRHMARDTLWIMVASLLAVFDITKGFDKDGRPLEPPPGHVSEIVVNPLPFKCTIKPRSKEAVRLIHLANVPDRS
ncbi:cytochrome P450 [Mycena maculata]|uniref:Cytochrome P450 n=1 Tax=Mycena maculata TaxID=230809 RepID=A0AAD7JAJ8_9AGAR|nr:cytochrome P450 [Mycena maculata]